MSLQVSRKKDVVKNEQTRESVCVCVRSVLLRTSSSIHIALRIKIIAHINVCNKNEHYTTLWKSHYQNGYV